MWREEKKAPQERVGVRLVNGCPALGSGKQRSGKGEVEEKITGSKMLPNGQQRETAHAQNKRGRKHHRKYKCVREETGEERGK